MKITRRRVILSLLFISVALAIFGFMRLLSAPAHGRSTGSADASQLSKKRPNAAKLPETELQSSYFDLSLPAGYKTQASQPVPGLLYSQGLIKPGEFGSLVINIAIKAMPEGGLGGDSSYRLREQHTNRYQLSSQVINGDIVRIANDAEAAAVVAFWPHANYLATISVSSGVGNPASDENAAELKALQPLLQAWQWR